LRRRHSCEGKKGGKQARKSPEEKKDRLTDGKNKKSSLGEEKIAMKARKGTGNVEEKFVIEGRKGKGCNKPLSLRGLEKELRFGKKRELTWEFVEIVGKGEKTASKQGYRFTGAQKLTRGESKFTNRNYGEKKNGVGCPALAR